MIIRYSPAAREDLRELRRYLVEEFGATVADKAVRKILTDIAALKDHPGLLRPLTDKINRSTDLKYYLCGKYSIAISILEGKIISILRVLDGRMDYATEVFSPKTEVSSNMRRRRR